MLTLLQSGARCAKRRRLEMRLTSNCIYLCRPEFMLGLNESSIMTSDMLQRDAAAAVFCI